MLFILLFLICAPLTAQKQYDKVRYSAAGQHNVKKSNFLSSYFLYSLDCVGIKPIKKEDVPMYLKNIIRNNKMLMAFVGFCLSYMYFHRLSIAFVLARKNIKIIHEKMNKMRINRHKVEINLKSTEKIIWMKVFDNLIESDKEKWDGPRKEILHSNKSTTGILIVHIDKNEINTPEKIKEKMQPEDLLAECNVCWENFSNPDSVFFYENHPRQYTCLDCLKKYEITNEIENKELPCLICGIEIKQITHENNNIFC